MLETSLLEVKPKKYPPAGSNRGGRVVKRFFFYISETKGEEKTGIGWFPFTIPKTIEVY